MSYSNWDYIPPKDIDLEKFGNNFTNEVDENAKAWGISSDTVNELVTAKDKFVGFLNEAKSAARTSFVVAEKNEARKEFVKIIRSLVKYQLQNPIITDAMRIKLGLHVHDTNPTNRPQPDSEPDVKVVSGDARRVKVHLRDAITGSKAKPFGVTGAVIAYAVLDATSTATLEDLTKTALATHTPYTLTFTDDDRAKKVFVAACWQNAKGENGPWSEIFSAVIP
jgi:hypothetical protein